MEKLAVLRVLVKGLFPACEYDIRLVSVAFRDLTRLTCWLTMSIGVLGTCCLGSGSATLKTGGEGYFRTGVQELEVVVARGLSRSLTREEKEAIQCRPQMRKERWKRTERSQARSTSTRLVDQTCRYAGSGRRCSWPLPAPTRTTMPKVELSWPTVPS